LNHIEGGEDKKKKIGSFFQRQSPLRAVGGGKGGTGDVLQVEIIEKWKVIENQEKNYGKHIGEGKDCKPKDQWSFT